MSYPYGGGGYPGQGYPAQQPQGYPSAGYPQAGYPGMPAPTQPGYGAPGNLPYASQPGLGFDSQPMGGQSVNMPTPESAGAGYGGYPAAQAPYPGAGYPAQGGGYPAAGPGPGYPSAAPGYPSAGGPGYPSAGPPQAGYPSAQPGYPGAGAPAQPGYPGAGAPAQPGYPGAGMQAQPQPGYAATGHAVQPGYNTGMPPANQAVPPPAQYQPAPAAAAGLAQGMQNLSMKGGQGQKMKGQGTLRAHSPFDPEKDCEILRKAMKGLGTDEKAIIDVLGNRASDQRQQIKTLFKTMYGKDLIKELKSELGGKLEAVVLALMMKPDEYLASQLRNAMKGVGTDEKTLIEIMCSRNNKEIENIKAAYKLLYSRHLENDLKSETSGHFQRLLISMSAAGRLESQPLDQQKAKHDAQQLHAAGEARWGTDESMFNRILASQGYHQLQAVFQEYQQMSRRTVEQAINSEFSGDIQDGLLAIVKCVQNRSAFFAERLYKSMKGLGTDDQTLIRIVTSRAEVDMVQIKQEFQRKYSQSLEAFIKDDVSGDYRRILTELVRSR